MGGFLEIVSRNRQPTAYYDIPPPSKCNLGIDLVMDDNFSTITGTGLYNCLAPSTSNTNSNKYKTLAGSCWTNFIFTADPVSR
jgi:hypothetical protein